MEDLERVKDRIAKLLRMAEDASSPNEAAIAAGRARSLMDKYQLDQYDIGERVAELFGSHPATRYFAAIPAYMDILAVAVAKYNDCQSRFTAGIVDFKKKPGDKKQVGKRVEFMGYESDAALGVQMYVRLLAAVDSLCKKYLSGQGYAKYPVRIGGQFKLGACRELVQRLEAMTKERDALTYSNGTALVLVKTAAVNDHFGEVEYVKKKLRTAQDIDEEAAYLKGRIDGKKIEIVPIIEGIKHPESGALYCKWPKEF